MKGSMSTDLGIITIDPEVIAKYAGSVAVECFGIVGMAFTFAKAQGGKIGNSLVEDDKLDLALEIMAKAKAKGVNLVLGCLLLLLRFVHSGLYEHCLSPDIKKKRVVCLTRF